MRLLVACSQCKRQFDVGGKAIGSRFRCHCGAAVTIRQPLGHEATVVRCSSCGAPRNEGSTTCHYCGADFTLHEQDLDTVCPACFARISDQAKFCHHCGLALLPESYTSQKTPLVCPACGKRSRLSNRQIGDVAVLECGLCAGFWLGTGIFGNLIEKASHGVSGLDSCLSAASRRSRPLDPTEQNGPRYRPCPFCGKLMNRRNYARRSGVIIDACNDHGVWFDADELPRILAWVRAGGQAEAEQQEADETARQERRDLAVRLARQRNPFNDELNQSANCVSPIAALAAIAAKYFL